MKTKTCCFTGHRIIRSALSERLQKETEQTILDLIKQGYLYFLTGGAQGYDTLAALAVLKIKEQHPTIQLILALPYPAQANNWPAEDRRIYEEIKEKADHILYISEHYFTGCMHKRNRYLVDHSSICIAYLTENRGGTFYTANYANTSQIPVINIATVLQ